MLTTTQGSWPTHNKLNGIFVDLLSHFPLSGIFLSYWSYDHIFWFLFLWLCGVCVSVSVWFLGFCYLVFKEGAWSCLYGEELGVVGGGEK